MSAPAPASAAEAMDLVLTGLSYLAAADPTALAAQTQAECLQGLEQAGSIATAARAWMLAAFTAGQGYCADADYGPAAWLIHRTQVTKGAARGHLGWARRAVTHPQVLLALAEGTVLTESMAGPSAGGPTRSRPPAGTRLMRSWSPPPGPGPARRTWPAWPRRSTPAPCPTSTATRSRTSRTARSPSRPPSPAPA